jgi:hypothetical protein
MPVQQPTGENAMEARQLTKIYIALLGLVLLGSLGIMPAARAATTLTLTNNVVTDNSGDNYSLSSGIYNAGSFIPTAAPNNTQFGKDREFRMIGSDGLPGGGGEKSLVGARDQPPPGSNSDTIEWMFPNDATLDAITGADTTPGAANDPNGASTGLFTNTFFKGIPWGFHQKNSGGTLSLDLAAGTLSVTWDQLVAQWADVFFPLGDPNPANECNTDGQGCGITLSGQLTNVVTLPDGSTSFDFRLFGEHRFTPHEDTEGGTNPGVGFAGWVAQWELQGSGEIAAVPLPASLWLFGSGLLGLMRIARRHR